MDYIERLINRQRISHAERIKELTLARVFHDENRIEGSGDRIESLTKEIAALKEELAQMDFLTKVANEGELNRIYLINKNNQKKGEKIS